MRAPCCCTGYVTGGIELHDVVVLQAALRAPWCGYVTGGNESSMLWLCYTRELHDVLQADIESMMWSCYRRH